MDRRTAIQCALGSVVGIGVGVNAAKADLIIPGRVRRNPGESYVDALINVRQAQRFTDAPVPKEHIDKIVQAGLNAPSALNLQPWFFSVVTDRELLKAIDKAANVDPNGRLSVGGSPLVIFVSTDDSDYGRYDAGAAADRMNVVANLLGYGCKSVATAPKAANAEEFRTKLHVPENYQIVAALLIGVEVEKSVDGVSGATTREPKEKKSFYLS